MNRWLKIGLIVATLTAFAGVVALELQPEEPPTSGGPAFAVNVERPIGARPLFGLLPGSELRFDNTSPGAAVESVGRDRLDLSADGWQLSIETDGEGRVGSGTRIVFPIELGGRHVRLRCRPADPAAGYLRSTQRAGSGELDGRFSVECATCENADSGKSVEWPSSPLTVSGSFQGLKESAR